MKPHFHPLIEQSHLYDGFKKVFIIHNEHLLLIQEKGERYLIKDQCGHFGVSLAKGKVESATIICPEHSISFNLLSGEVINRP